MKFGPVLTSQAVGHILAHSIGLSDVRLRKGRTLSADDADRLLASGVSEVVVAQLEPADLSEDEAAKRIAAALACDPETAGLSRTAPFTGRVNLYAEKLGVLVLDEEKVAALNQIDETVTIATLPDRCRVSARQMVATIKIIPYAAPEAAVVAAEELFSNVPSAIRVEMVQRKTASLILTRTRGMTMKVLQKGADAVRNRLRALDVAIIEERIVAHDETSLAHEVRSASGEMVLILTGSATSDRGDVGPTAVLAAGGTLERVGMPVDPGNLLFLGAIGERPVIGLPGCARSPKLNGADWVIERVACGLTPTSAEIALMGVGGLLKEIPSRPSPRAITSEPGRRPIVSAVVLAAGQSSRMRGRDKLLEQIEGETVLERVVRSTRSGAVDETIVMLRPDDTARRAALQALAPIVVENHRAAEGMGTSVAAGVAGLRPDADAALIVLADMPEITSQDLERLVAAFDPEEGRAIVRATDANGAPGHPVLFGRRFFELLRGLDGDRGAREVLRDYPEFVVDVALADDRAITDLDTPEDWDAWRRRDRSSV